jgi:anti-sigma regulatory factor (Ser/Thr protein kinase)
MDWLKKTATEVELIVNEFLNNIILHGLDNSKRKSIVVYIKLDQKIEITFYDAGKYWAFPHDFMEEISEDFDDAIALKESGRGIQMIGSMISSFSRKRFEEINVTTFYKEIEP